MIRTSCFLCKFVGLWVVVAAFLQAFRAEEAAIDFLPSVVFGFMLHLVGGVADLNLALVLIADITAAVTDGLKYLYFLNHWQPPFSTASISASAYSNANLTMLSS